MKNKINSQFSYFTSSPRADEFGTFDKDQILVAQKKLFDNSSDFEILKFAQYLMSDYPYTLLSMENSEKRELFAFSMAQCWIFSRTVLQQSSFQSFRNCFASPLSVLINIEYELDIDEGKIIENITGKKACNLLYPKPENFSIEYHNRFSQWGFLNTLHKSPTCELKTLVLVANAMSTQANLLEYSRISSDPLVEKGIVLLNKHGLLTMDPPNADLLYIFPLKRIINFASENNLKNLPRRKSDVISLITKECKSETIIAFVNELLNDPQYGYGYTKERFIQPKIQNAKPFQEYIRSELNRLSLYLEYISCIEYNHKTIISAVVKRDQPGDRPGDFYQQYAPHKIKGKAFTAKEFISGVPSSDIQKIQKYWDAHCDTLLARIRDENPTIFPVEILVSEILIYWERTGLLTKYKYETRNPMYETHWYWLLNSYVSYLLGMDETYKLKPIQRICNGCGQTFREWSVSFDFAVRIGGKIEFCDSCYNYIFNHHFMANTTKAFQIPEHEMVGILFELSKALSFIPTRSYMEHIELSFQSIERQIEVGKLLLRMPAYDIYIEKFGNWLKCLTLAGVLDSGHKKTSRGIQCLANDGHVCLSLGEKAIDDWLSNHNIQHEKESLYPYDESLNPFRLSRVDWKVGNTVIEYAGLMDEPEYALKMERKKQLAKKYALHLIIIKPADLFCLDEKLQEILI